MKQWIRVLTCALTLSLTACATHSPLARWVPSPNHGPRQPMLVVLHATEQDSVAQSLLTLSTRNGGGRVSAHYLRNV